MNLCPAFSAFRMIPFQTFQIPEGNVLKVTEKKEKTGADDEKEKAIRCADCGFGITTAKERIEMEGHHSHVFNNPAGYLFEIGCFASAPGCVNRGEPTMEFTWFAGFAWRFALCGNCSAHLGWRYQSGGGRSFYGLILDSVREDPA